MRFEKRDDLRGAEFLNLSLSGARFRNVDLTGARAMEVVLVNARFSGLIHGLPINDIEVAPLIRAEMDRRYPERTKLRPTNAAREERMEVVRVLVSELDDELLRQRRGDETVNACLCTLFDEEWHHNWFANRDLDTLETRGPV